MTRMRKFEQHNIKRNHSHLLRQLLQKRFIEKLITSDFALFFQKYGLTLLSFFLCRDHFFYHGTCISWQPHCHLSTAITFVWTFVLKLTKEQTVYAW